jgi:uncharacterized protein (TIGR02147 family)
MPDIYEYLEYRLFLKDHFEEQRKRFRHFTYRYIAGKTGLDASFYVKVLQKQLHLSTKSIPVMADFLNLDKRQAQYFSLLIKFNKANSPDECKIYFEKLIRLKGPASKVLDPRQYEFFKKWYHAAIKEALNFLPLKDEFAELGRRLVPPITEAQVRKAVTLLEELGLIRKDPQGVFVLVDKNITTGDGWKSIAPIAIRNFQKEFLQRAHDALDIIPKEDRDISTLTFSVSRQTVSAMRERISEMRKELIQMANGDQHLDCVYQLNVQLFPLLGTKPGLSP